MSCFVNSYLDEVDGSTLGDVCYTEVADDGTFKGKTGTVVRVDKTKSSQFAKLRMIVKLDKGNKKVSVVVNDWKHV